MVISGLHVRAVRVPMSTPHRTASGVVSESPLVLCDVLTDEGIVGHSVTFTYSVAALKPTADLIANLGPLIEGKMLAPVELGRMLAARFRLLGTHGLVGMAIAAIEMAAWDAHARSHGLGLARLLGGVERPIQAYGAVGYDGAAESAKVAEDWARRGFRGVKAKVGYPTVKKDVEVIRAIRSALGPNAAIMVDYNQCLTPAEAIERMRVLDDEGLTWVEEPTMAHDHRGHALIAGAESARFAACARSGGVGLRDAGGDEDWRSQRMAESGGAGRGGGGAGFIASVAGDQRAPAVPDSDGALARICGLVESGP
jgi:mandelate racemase